MITSLWNIISEKIEKTNLKTIDIDFIQMLHYKKSIHRIIKKISVFIKQGG